MFMTVHQRVKHLISTVKHSSGGEMDFADYLAATGLVNIAVNHICPTIIQANGRLFVDQIVLLWHYVTRVVDKQLCKTFNELKQ